MLHPRVPENTAYNPMIYITFFIVILIDNRGVIEAERGGKARTQNATPAHAHARQKRQAHHHSTERKKR